jgi:hypothetical protein
LLTEWRLPAAVAGAGRWVVLAAVFVIAGCACSLPWMAAEAFYRAPLQAVLSANLP